MIMSIMIIDITEKSVYSEMAEHTPVGYTCHFFHDNLNYENRNNFVGRG